MQFQDSLKVDAENPSANAGAVQTASVVVVNPTPVNLDPHGNLTAAWTAGNFEVAFSRVNGKKSWQISENLWCGLTALILFLTKVYF